MRRTQCTPISASKHALRLAKRYLSSISIKIVISFLIVIFCSLDSSSTPFHAANAVHTDFSVETCPATRKTQCFLPFDVNCYFFPDCDISEFKGSFHSIPSGERSAGRFQCRNKHSHSQNSIFLRFRRKLLFPS
jgi:hypothetical protein